MIRLIPLQTGWLETDLRVVTGASGRIDLPIPSWLIEHRAGLVLFDTGMHIDLQSSTDRIGRAASVFKPRFDAGEELSARLDGRGIRPSDIDLIVFSHLHFDHVGGTQEIPDARIIVQEAEWAAGQDQRLLEAGVYNRADYDLGHDVQCVTGEFDVFGDGQITCVPSPGHTVGHQSLRVELESGPVVLTADCVYFETMLTDMRVPKLGHDPDLQLESMRALSNLRDEHGCRLLFGHDQEQLQAIPAGGLT